MFKGAVLIAALGTLVAASVASAHIVDTRGSSTCEAWTKQRPKQSKLLEAWMLGFVSGQAQIADIDIPKGITSDAIFVWMDKYCKKNPRQGLAMGGYMLFSEIQTDGRLK